MTEFNTDKIEEKIGIVFKDKKLLKTCFTHVSYANEFREKSNENLEFLGDSVLGLVIGEYLYDNFDEAIDEGTMSQIRSKIVCTESLLSVSKKLGIAKYLLLTNNKDVSADYHQKQFADVVEALISGIYIDQGLTVVKSFILSIFSDKLKKESLLMATLTDYKTILQELVQKQKNSKIEYVFIERTGEDHEPQFTYAVEINGKELGRATGHSKRFAQTTAAEQALKKLKERGNKI